MAAPRAIEILQTIVRKVCGVHFTMSLYGFVRVQAQYVRKQLGGYGGVHGEGHEQTNRANWLLDKTSM